MAKLYFKYGAMGSSKTATALITKYNYEERGMRVWLIKPAADRRDGEFTLRSRIGLTAQCEAIGPECDLRERYAAHGRADVIIVDECQFLTGQQIDQLRELVELGNVLALDNGGELLRLRRIRAAGQSDLGSRSGGRRRGDNGLDVGRRLMERTRGAHENEQCRIYNCGNGPQPVS